MERLYAQAMELREKKARREGAPRNGEPPRCIAHLGGPLCWKRGLLRVIDARTDTIRAYDLRRATRQLQDVHARAITVDDVDQAAIVDIDVVGHIVAVRRVGVGFRHVEGNLRHVERLADIPDAQT